MRLSRYFLPTLKNDPSEAQIVSHRLMLRAGMIMQTTAGIYSWLPLGLNVLKNIETIIRYELNLIGALETVMPTVQPVDLWHESNRYDAYGEETLRFHDRHQREFLYAPSAEEAFSDIIRKNMHSYRELPKILYQLHWKFRDEIRPRFGVMRGREFLMKDAYSVDIDEANALVTYRKVMEAYVRIFARLGLLAIPVRASTGPIGGDYSHEFHILTNTGESAIFYDPAIEEIMKNPTNSLNLDQLMNLYCMEKDMHDHTNCPLPSDQLKQARGIEVGHVFYIGKVFSESMNVMLQNGQGKMFHPHMGCYGIGVSRLVGAIIEACHDEVGIIWPPTIAPYKVGLINIKGDNVKTTQACEELYIKLQEKGISVLYDDRDESAGAKFSTMDLIGLPWQLRVGLRGLEKGMVEVKCRRTKKIQDISLESALSQLVHELAVVA